MASTKTPNSERDRALAQLAHFTSRILPGILRRIGSWKGIPGAALHQLTEDVVQELTIDCLQHPAKIVRAKTNARHARWIRLAERWIYRQHVRPHRRESVADPDAIAAPDRWSPGSCVGEATPPRLVRLKNGRCNLRASARQAGSSVLAMRRQLDRLGDRLDRDGTAVEFWRRRLAEALTGLGADLLRQRGTLQLLPAPHRAPDPAARLRRVRRLAGRFPVHRTPLDVRKILARWTRSPDLGPAAARRALEQATTLSPDRPEGWLWLFEAALADDDLGGAVATLRAVRRRLARRCGRVVLARARLLEVRGRWPGAIALLARAQRRQPGEARLRQALQGVTD